MGYFKRMDFAEAAAIHGDYGERWKIAETRLILLIL
jgi:hypothetical protein